MIHRFGDWIGVRELVVDVTKLEPEETAVVIKTFLEKIAVEQAMMMFAAAQEGGTGANGSVGKRSGKRSRMNSANASREDVHMAGMPSNSSSSQGRTSIAAITSPTSPIGDGGSHTVL